MPQDGSLIAKHRAMMFYDMGLLPQVEIALLQEAGEQWIADLLVEGSYVGWMVQCGDDVIGGGGLHLRPHGPVPGCLESGMGAHIANVYIEATHRRRGLAEALMTCILDWALSNNLKELTLTASEQGRSLYQRLRFVSSPEFHTLKLY